MDTVICLKDIDIQIKKGQFVCIIGKVGSGKSSLLSALIGDLLPVPKGLVENYKKGEGWEKELDQDEAIGFMRELVYHHQ
jgi:ABC-type lipoprotein export system ATPase subunit